MTKGKKRGEGREEHRKFSSPWTRGSQAELVTGESGEKVWGFGTQRLKVSELQKD